MGGIGRDGLSDIARDSIEILQVAIDNWNELHPDEPDEVFTHLQSRCSATLNARSAPEATHSKMELVDGLEALRRVEGLLKEAKHYDGAVNGVTKRDLRMFAAALRARPVGEVKVKALVWGDGHCGPLEFPSSYHIAGDGEDGFKVSLSWRTCDEALNGPDGDLVFSSAAEAEAAAQADYDARIRAALEGGEG